MFKVIFKNFDKSEFALESAQQRLVALVEKFPDLESSQVRLTMAIENSATQAGPDLFRVKIYISSGRYSGVTVEKADSNLFAALAELGDHMLEKLNRYGDKSRIKSRSHARRLKRKRLDQFADLQSHSEGE